MRAHPELSTGGAGEQMPSKVIIPGVDDNLALALKYEQRAEAVRAELRWADDERRAWFEALMRRDDVGVRQYPPEPAWVRRKRDEHRLARSLAESYLRDAEAAERAHHG